jgi:ATP-dependent helicase HrpB
VLDPSEPSKLIFSTNVAETSITVPHVNLVIDTGLERRPHYDSDLDLISLTTSQITKFSSIQRRGRAGRTSAGQYIRLWTKNDELHLEPEPVSEIQNCDLVSGLVALKTVSDVNPLKAEFFEAPPEKRLANAVQKLKALGLIDSGTLRLTPLAKRASRHPFDVRFGLCIEEATDSDQKAKLVALALLADRAPMSTLKDAAAVLQEALSLGNFRRELNLELGRLGLSLQQTSLEVASLLASTRILLAKNFSERVAVKTPSGDIVLASGRRVEGVTEACFFLLAGQDKSQTVQASIALALESNDLRDPRLTHLIVDQAQLSFDISSNKLSKTIVKSFGFAPLVQALRVAVGPDDAFRYFSENKKTVVEALGRSALWTAEINRLALAKELKPDLVEGDVESLVHQAIVQRIQTEGLSELPLQQSPVESLSYAVPHKTLAEIDQQLPKKMLIPSGRELELNYNPHQRSIVLSVRIQEIFGWAQSPHLGWGQLQLQFELLSPGYKPVQKTSDLKSFWTNSYPSLRKELMRQYPRHSWPEDPYTAQAVAKGRSQKK